MSTVKEKVAKLLALSGSPNEKEAQEAMLKARELMAKHKLSPEECQGQSGAKVVMRTVGIECTKMTDPWAVQLGAVIGRRYCCEVYRGIPHPGSKKTIVGFVGLEDDFEVCSRVYRYAYECVQSWCRRNRALRKSEYSGKELREMCNAYGWGFWRGLEAAFAEQDQEHQEWALVLSLPRVVQEAVDKMGKRSSYGKADLNGWRARYANAGYAEGKKFAPERQLEASDMKNKASA